MTDAPDGKVMLVKKRKSLVFKIVSLVCVAALLMCVSITAAGSLIIYYSTDREIKKEIQTAANSMYKVFNTMFEGDYSSREGELLKGGKRLTEEDFEKVVSALDNGSGIDFTVFLGDTRIMTSVRNADGSLAVGTKAADEVVAKVIDFGTDFFTAGVLVNGTRYVAYYIPIKNSAGNTLGMVFAGKPSTLATANVLKMLNIFFLISFVVLLIAVVVCTVFSKRVVRSLFHIKDYMLRVSSGDFSEKPDEAALARTDEIGDIARSAGKMSESLQTMIERDPLTGLLNRRSCRIKMDKMTENGTAFSVIMGDIDFFKRINDTYGHACGDDVLKGVSGLLAETASENGGFVARWGGEEFVMALPDKTVNGAGAVLETLMEKIRAFSVESGGNTIRVTMTFGVTRCEPNGNIEHSISRADELLYDGKQTGRNKVVADMRLVTAAGAVG